MVSAQPVPKNWANPTVLKWARLEVGLEPGQVESLAGLPAERVIEWERARAAPTLNDLEVLAELYACPVGYFFLDSPPPSELPLSFRGLAPEKIQTLSYETRLRLKEFVRLSEYASFVLKAMGRSWEVRFDYGGLNESIERFARRERERVGFTPEIRSQWTSPDDVFSFWRRAVEDLGILVISLKLNPQEVRGASTWTPPDPPAILVNHADMEAATGRTFTLLHEWAHLLVKRPGVVCDFRGSQDDMQLEKFANAFAAELLVARDEFEDVLGKERLLEPRESWGDGVLDRIRTPFKVSRDVVAILLEDMRLAPAGFYRRKRIMWEKRRPFFAGRGVKVPERGLTKASRRLREIGMPLAHLISAGYESGAIPKLDLADLLDMRVEQAERFVEWVQAGAKRPDAP